MKEWENLKNIDQLSIGDDYFIAYRVNNKWEIEIMQLDGYGLFGEGANIPFDENGIPEDKNLKFIPMIWPKRPE